MASVTMKEWMGSRFGENQSCSSSKNNRIDLLNTTLVPDNCPERSAVRPDILLLPRGTVLTAAALFSIFAVLL